MNVTVRQLRAFVTVARLGSFVAASRALHVTPSALSIVIGELERVVGFRVLDRTTRKVRLSGAGEQYFPYAERILLDMDDAERCAADLKNQKTGIVRIATTQVIGWTLMPQAYAAFREVRPQVRVDPVDVAIDDILPSIARGQADIGIILPVPADDSLAGEPLFTSRVHLACPARHRWARRKAIEWREIADEPLIFTGHDTAARIHAQLPQGPMLNAAFQVGNTTSALALVASGFGVAVCSGFVKPLGRVHDLRMIPLVKPAVLRAMMLYTNRTRQSSPAVESLRQFLLQHFRRAQDTPIEEYLRF
jgi:DNA-binding transcriptional LysR family regulator